MMLLLFLLSTFTLMISRVHAEVILPTVTLNCTTDYVNQARGIHVTWFLNSTVAGDTDRVSTCKSSINCTNGSYAAQEPGCKRPYEWNYNNIPLTEQFCNVSVSFVDLDESQDNDHYFTNYTTCSFSDDIDTTVDVYGTMENLTVGDKYEIQCEVYTDQLVHSDIVNITWIRSNNDTVVTDTRISITTTNSTGHNHTSTLQFSYLSEDDEGLLFTCQVTILNNTDSESFEIKEILIATPNVSVTVLNHQTVGSELSLKCNVTTARGVTSNVEIVWMTTSGTEVGELNDSRISISPTESSGSFHTSTLQFSYLSEDDDESVYICSAAIHNINTSRSVELNEFHIPLPTVTVTALNQDNDNLSLRCDVDIVKGITSSMDIVWKMNNREVQRVNGNITEEVTSYTYYYNDSVELNTNSDVVYQCQVIINASPPISNTDNITINAVPSIAPTTPVHTPSSSEDTLPNAAVISMISLGIVIAILIVIVFIGIYMHTKRKKVKQVRRNSELFQPFDFDVDYSVIGKDAPSTCESLSANQKVTEWIKRTQMPTVDEECESVISTTNEGMLNFVHGYKEGTQMKTTEFGYDSGVDSELNSGSGKTSSKQNAYISHQAMVDMCHANTDEPNQLNLHDVTVGLGNANNTQLVATVQNSVNNNPSQNLHTSLVKLGPSMISPAANDPYQSLDVKENHTNDKSRQPLSYATNVDSAETAGNGSYIDRYVSSNDNINNPLTVYPVITGSYTNSVDSHDTMTSTSHPQPVAAHTDINMTAKLGEYVDHYSGSINKPPQLHFTSNDTMTATDGSYIDHYATPDGSQPFSHSTHTYNATAAAEEEPNYIDRYIDDNDKPFTNPSPLHSTDNGNLITAVDGTYVDHYATSNDNQPFSHTTHSNTTATAELGSYVDRYIDLNSDGKLTNAEVAEIANNELSSITNNQLATNVMDGSYIAADHFVTVQPGSESDDVQQIKSEQRNLNSPLMGYTTGYIETDI